MRTLVTLSSTLALTALLTACGDSGDSGASDDTGGSAAQGPVTILSGLNNPAGVTFSPDGHLTVCAAGASSSENNGRVITWKDGESRDYITGFPTEFWKVGKDGAPNRFKLGPLSAVWTSASQLVVSNGGLTDGADHLLIFDGEGDASTGTPSDGIGATSDDPADKGEGNLTGLSASADGSTVYVCGQGADVKTWVLSCDVAARSLEGLASADDNGIAINSPMQTLVWDASTLLVLYSGAGGKEDGLIVSWSLETGKPTAQWTLPGIFDPMGMARVPGSDELVVVDNNWSLTEVKDGRAARVSLPDGQPEATVTMLTETLKGPTSCAFGPDGRLYVSLLGPKFDADQGSVIALSL